MTKTHSQFATQFLRNVLKQRDESPMEIALAENRHINISHWTDMSDQELRDLTYTDPTTGAIKTVPIGDVTTMQNFRNHVPYCLQHLSDPNYDGTTLTEDAFKKWRTSNLAKGLMAILNPTPVSTNPATKSSTQIELDNFKKGIKPDPSLYPVLTQDSQWDSWNRTVVALARAQAVSDVLNPTFTPVLLEEITLFNEKQKYMYSVFEQCLQSDKGKSIVRTHEDTFDVQKVYKAMFEYSNLSTKAHLESTAILTYITAACLGDGTWKGSTHKFILHWEEHVQQYEKLVDQKEHFPPTIKLHMLQNAVHGIAELRQIKVQADQLATHSGKKMDYDEYIPLLSSAAAQYDSQFTSSHGSKAAAHRQNFAHDFSDQYKEYDIDTPSAMILANRTSFDAMMPGHVWSQLAPEDKAVWDKLSDNTKQLILNARARGDQRKPPSTPNFRPNPKFKPKRKVNIHDFIQVFQHLTSDENDDEDDVPDESPDAETEEQEAPEPDDTIDLLSYATNRQNDEVPPAHLAKMLSNTIARYEKRGATKANKATQKKVTYKANMCALSNLIIRTMYLVMSVLPLPKVH